MLSAVSPGLGVLILGNSILEGVGTAIMIPPVYILTTLLFTELTSRARAFGVISAMGAPPREYLKRSIAVEPDFLLDSGVGAARHYP